MSEARRYKMRATAEFGQDAWTDPVEDANGGWVRYDDYAQARREAKAEAAKTLDDWLPDSVEISRQDDGIVSFEMYAASGLTCGGADFHPNGKVVWTLTRGQMVKSGKDEPENMDTCEDCMGSGYAGHPDSGRSCAKCGGAGGTPARPSVAEAARPGALERIVWSAMVWARENPGGPDAAPEYTDRGNSFAETECRATVQRILRALVGGQAS